MPRNASDSMDLDNFKHAPKIRKKRWKGAPPKLRSIRSHDPYQPYLPEVPALGGMTSPATVLSRGKTPDLRSVTFDGATAGLRGGGAPAAALELLSRSELTAWHLSLQNETQSFNSLAIYGELRLREALLLETDPDEFYSNAPHRAAKGCEIPNFKGSYLGRFPLVSADFWTSDHLSERS